MAPYRFPSLKRLHDALNLQYSCGYITMVNPALKPKVRSQSIHSRTETINEILKDSALALHEENDAKRRNSTNEKEGDGEIEEEEEGHEKNDVVTREGDGEEGNGREKEKEKENENGKEKEKNENSKKEEDPSYADEGDWVIMTLSLGIPLFDPRLNEDVCNRIEAHKLFHEENILLNTKYSGRACNGLLDFIEGNQAPDYRFEVEPGVIPYPTKVVQFNGRTLCK